MGEKQSLGIFIAKKRKEANMTQKDLAEKLYVTESAVSKWERGVSYPDISLVSSICETLKINEHELITASEDKTQRKIEKDARKFNNMKKIYMWSLYILYGLAVLTCFICNIAIDHTLSWFYIVLTSIAVSFSLTSLPFLLDKNKGVITLASFVVTLVLLLMTCCLYTGGHWFWLAILSTLYGLTIIFLPFLLRAFVLPKILSKHKTLICFIIDTIFLFVLVPVAVAYSGANSDSIILAIKITAVTVVPAWLMMIVIRYLRVNKLYKASICMTIATLVCLLINSFLDMLIDNKPFALQKVNFSDWSDEYFSGNVNFIVYLSLLAIALILFIGATVSEVITQKNRIKDNK